MMTDQSKSLFSLSNSGTIALLLSAMCIPSIGHTQQVSDLFLFTFDNVGAGTAGDVTDALDNPIVTERPDFETDSDVGDGLFIPITPIPADDNEDRFYMSLPSPKPQIRWGADGGFTISQDVDVASISFDYEANGLSADGTLFFGIANDQFVGEVAVGLTRPIGNENNPSSGSAEFTFDPGELVLSAGEIGVTFDLINTDPNSLIAPEWDINAESARGLGWFAIDNFAISYYNNLLEVAPTAPLLTVATQPTPTFFDRVDLVPATPLRNTALTPGQTPPENETTALCKEFKDFRCPESEEDENFFIDEASGFSWTPERAETTWVRLSHNNMDYGAYDAGSSPGFDTSTTGVQAGHEIYRKRSDDGSLFFVDVTAHALDSNTTLAAASGGGGMDALSLGLGFTASWITSGGFYLDGQARYSWTDSDLTDGTGSSIIDGLNGNALLGSVELGQHFRLGTDWTLIPQLQLSHTIVRNDDFSSGGTTYSDAEGEQTVLRAGTFIGKESNREDGGWTRIYATANIHETLDSSSSVSVNGTRQTTKRDDTLGSIGLGFQTQSADSSLSFFGEVGYTADIDDPDETHGSSVELGIGFNW